MDESKTRSNRFFAAVAQLGECGWLFKDT
jgi:hypothetical protein